MKVQHEENGCCTIQLNEYDIHNMMSVGQYALLKECQRDDGKSHQEVEISSEVEGCVDDIKVVPKDHPEEWTQERIDKWELLLNRLFRTFNELDGMIHDDAEYTC